jgi:hypothetical protein
MIREHPAFDPGWNKIFNITGWTLPGVSETAANARVFDFFHCVHGDARCRNSVPFSYRSSIMNIKASFTISKHFELVAEGFSMKTTLFFYKILMQ